MTLGKLRAGLIATIVAGFALVSATGAAATPRTYEMALVADPAYCLSSNPNGTNVGLWECNGHPRQQWSLSRETLEIRQGDMCLVAYHAGPGTDVTMWPCNGAENQKWVKEEQVYYHPRSGLCLDADSREGFYNGSRVQVWNCHEGDNQKWDLR